jgi:hypothetical protein
MHCALKLFIEDNHQYDTKHYLPIYREYFELLVAMRDHPYYSEPIKNLWTGQFAVSWSVFAPLYIQGYFTHMPI